MNKILLTILFLCLLAGTVTAQDRTVSGKVTDFAEGTGLPGVNVVVQGTTKGTTTDADGNYTLTLGPSENTLVFSFVGYAPKTVSVENQTTVDVAMEADITSLNEVVVIGYGTQQEKDLTSSVATVKTEEILKTPTSQAMQSLQGRVAGVQIVSSGAPGASPTVRVRGVGTFKAKVEPLYVVDGMFFDNIDFLNTADIETITILKDASAAAIYGVRAANGVVLITTKSGTYDQAPQITYNGYYGVQVAQNVLKMSNAEQFVQYVGETGSSADQAFVDQAFSFYGRSRVNPNVPNVNTDWYDEVLQTAPIQNHTIGIDGGGKEARYSVGVSYFDQGGLLRETRNNYERVNLRAKVDFNANKWLKVGANVNVSNATRFVADEAVWFQTYFAVPILPKYDEENNTTATPYALGNAKLLGYRDPQNPFFTLKYKDDRFKILKGVANFYADAEIIPDKLSFRTAINANVATINERKVDFGYNSGSLVNNNSIKKLNTTTFNQIWDNTLTFTHSIGSHNITLLGGYSYRSEQSDLLYARGTGLTPAPEWGSEELWYFYQRGGSIDITDVGDYDPNNTSLGKFYGESWFGRVAYNYDDRYLFYATVRRDGTSKFQQKWGTFPTVGLGWVISEEDFFSANFVNFLKIRGSWGRLGNDSSPAAIGVPTLVGTETSNNGGILIGNRVDAYYDLLDKWETSEETNIGLTARLLSDRLAVEFDYYVRETDDAALDLYLPLARDQIRRNRGIIRNQGIELAVNWSDQLNDKLRYNVGFNIATLKNEVKGLGGQQYVNGGTAEFRQRSTIGQPVDAFFGYEVVGVFQNQSQIDNSGYTDEFLAEQNLAPGDFFYKDQNDDGIINDLDRVILGSYLPEFTYGFNLGVSFMNFDLSATFQGQSGQEILNRKRGQMIFTNDTNIDAELADHLWRGEGTSNKYPSAAGLRKGWNQKMSNYFVEDGSYFRIQNVQLAYNIRNKEVMGVKIPETSVSFTAEKPLTVFNYNGFNPEVANGIDTQTYPIPAVYTVGLNVRF